MMPVPLHIAAAYALVALLTCDPQPRPAVVFHFDEKEPVFSTVHTTRELRGIAPMGTGVNLQRFPVTSGLTQGRIEAETSVLFKSQQMLTGDYCLWPQEVDVTVKYQALVNIAREYAPDSCRFAVTKQHELRHVAADEEALKEYLPKLKAAAEAKAAEAFPTGPFTLAARDQARNAILEAVKGAVGDELEQLDHDRQLRQQAIDTVAEYARLSRACPGEPIQ